MRTTTVPWISTILAIGLTAGVTDMVWPAAEPQAPHIKSTWTMRVTNRRFVSHILHERIRDKSYVTLITTHGPTYDAFHARSHALRHACGTYKQCLQLMMRLDRHLRAGHNLGMRLKGSFITRFLFYKRGAGARNR